MTSRDGGALAKWLDAEAAYAQTLAPFQSGEAEAPPLWKSDLLKMVELRCRADRHREDYFAEGNAESLD
ncbi:MAG: hypothetical protein IPO93_07185 [Actinobacteria bacterium]|nr:hypothetical protein [Actinomycetota bacterium]